MIRKAKRRSMTQSLAQLQAEWRAMKDEGVSDFDSGVVAGFGGAANELQPHVEREAAAQAKSLADERRIAELEAALREIEGLSGLDNEIAGPGCSVIVADRVASIHQIAGSILP